MRKSRVIVGVMIALAVLGAIGEVQAQAMSNRCFTPQFWCWLPVYGAIGTPCYCATPYGPVGGYVQ